MSADKKRVDFNAPAHLVQQADAIAQVLDRSRTDILIEALREKVTEAANDREVKAELRRAYYEGTLSEEIVEAVLGKEEATRMRLLREGLSREPPAPNPSAEPVPAAEFFDGEIPEWTAESESEQ